MTNENKEEVVKTTEVDGIIAKNTPAPAKTPAAGVKKVEVDASKLTEVLNLVKSQATAISDLTREMEVLKNKTSDKPLVAKKVKDHYCFLRKLNNQVVKGFKGNVYKEYDERQKEFILYVDVILYDGKVVNKVDYLDFISNAEKVKAKITKKEVNQVETVEAYINQTEPKGEFGTQLTEVQVPVESIVEEYTFDVEVEDLGTLTLSEKVINI
jgi:hypothetical protein